jgi:hypothetical protein
MYASIYFEVRDRQGGQLINADVLGHRLEPNRLTNCGQNIFALTETGQLVVLDRAGNSCFVPEDGVVVRLVVPIQDEEE